MGEITKLIEPNIQNGQYKKAAEDLSTLILKTIKLDEKFDTCLANDKMKFFDNHLLASTHWMKINEIISEPAHSYGDEYKQRTLQAALDYFAPELEKKIYEYSQSKTVVEFPEE